MTTTWDEMGIGEEPNPPHLGTADDLEQDLNALFERFRLEQVARMANATAMLAALESVTHFGPVTLERRGERFTVVFSNGKDADEKLEIAGYGTDLPTAVANYLDGLPEHTNKP